MKCPASHTPARPARRSPCGERGLKWNNVKKQIAEPESRSPCGERGLKYCSEGCYKISESRSPCGERGLKYKAAYCLWASQSRSPCGERGLKSDDGGKSSRTERSLPVRGAWIEITATDAATLGALLSLPVRGAWIEIACSTRPPASPCRSLPVRGAWIEMPEPAAATRGGTVAPRAGSVD